MKDLQRYIEQRAAAAKKASRALRTLKAARKNEALLAVADVLDEDRNLILEANRIDHEAGKKAGLTDSFLDRLLLTDGRIDSMKTSLREISALEDPVGEVTGVRRTQGFFLERVRIPIGVIAMIYESRPNVTVDAAALCLKSGNSVVLRGGSEALESNRALTAVLKKALSRAGIDSDAVQLIERREHEGVTVLATRRGLIDLVIPRGGERLIEAVTRDATVPVIKHDKGVCHLYVDGKVDMDMALSVVTNAKVQRPGTCNALETLLVHERAAADLLPRLRESMAGVELRGCPKTRKILEGIGEASEDDFHREYLDLILSIRIVRDVGEAIDHIERYGSSHTDGILSTDVDTVEKFVQSVDSAVVTVNASTRLSDGGVFGLGAEIGISTDKLHARGPMGLRELTTYKWVVRGRGDLRS